MKLSRFLALIENGRAYFAATTQFADPFEGAVAVQVNAPPPDPRYAEMENMERVFFELKRMTKVSYWHRADYESDAMWKLYAEASKGIAICTTPERMRAAFKPFRLREDYGVEDLWGSPVSYLDLTQVRMRGGNMLKRFFWKHRAFAWEREFRLAISLRSAEEWGVRSPLRESRSQSILMCWSNTSCLVRKSARPSVRPPWLAQKKWASLGASSSPPSWAAPDTSEGGQRTGLKASD